MRYIVSAALVVVAVIHLLPVAGALSGANLTRLYGISLAEPNLEILMRHRAVLFGLLGTFVLLAAFRPAFQLAAMVAGFVSVASFLYLAWTVGGYDPQVGRVVAADVVALACLAVGAVAYALAPVES